MLIKSSSRFISRLVWGIVAFFAILLALSLARWQASKADTKTALAHLYQHRESEPTLAIHTAQLSQWFKGSSDEWRLRNVSLGARAVGMPIYQWVGREGRWGRCLYGLLRLPSDQYIIAKLGWYPAELRSNEPVVWPVEWSAHSQWVGRLHIPERRLSLFKANQAAGIEIESIDFESLKRFWSVRDLFPAVLELEHQPKGCETLLPSNDAIYKHRSYQYQWYGIAILIGVLYGYYGFRRST